MSYQEALSAAADNLTKVYVEEMEKHRKLWAESNELWEKFKEEHE